MGSFANKHAKSYNAFNSSQTKRKGLYIVPFGVAINR